jgi:hypothetical protein
MNGKPHLVFASTPDLRKKRRAVGPETAGDKEKPLPKRKARGEAALSILSTPEQLKRQQESSSFLVAG